MNLILASQSPRRIELMRLITPDFQIRPSQFDESSIHETDPDQLCAALARGKAEAIAAPESDCVIGADTIVARNGHIFGKPRDRQDAREMLRSLSGGAHQVITGVCILFRGERREFQSHTNVYFYPLSDGQIEAYLDTGEPFDKAGAYGIQGKGGLFVERIEGDYNNVVGFPAARVYQTLQQIRALEFSRK